MTNEAWFTRKGCIPNTIFHHVFHKPHYMTIGNDHTTYLHVDLERKDPLSEYTLHYDKYALSL